jgi:CBS domain-containing protein
MLEWRASGGDLMRISDILRIKGNDVITVRPDDNVERLVAVLADRRIGAAVVSRDGRSIDGIASERDVVRALAQRGPSVLAEPVTAVHTAEVRSIDTQASLEELMRLMTEHRIRHLPVVDDGRLCGIVSIGDVVKNRIDELETEHAALSHYIAGDR